MLGLWKEYPCIVGYNHVLAEGWDFSASKTKTARLKMAQAQKRSLIPINLYSILNLKYVWRHVTRLSAQKQSGKPPKMPNSWVEVHGFHLRCNKCSTTRMPVGGGMQPPPSGFTNACVHSAAQHALLEDIQSLWPAGTTPSTGVRVPVTHSNMDSN